MEGEPLNTTLEYEPLNTTNHEIRLLKILSTSPLLCCYLTHHSLRPKTPQPTYSALSYVWGPSEDPCLVLVNGQATLISQNLFWALNQLGDESPGYLWVDALCINQNNAVERANQVLRMGEIYSKAKNVIAWLGPGTTEAKLAFRLIRSLWQEIASPTAETSHQRLWNEEWVGQCRAMGKLCQLPYWRRTWIIQEIALAQELEFRCGPFECQGMALFNAVDMSPFATYGTERTENWENVLDGEEYEAMETVRGLMTFKAPWGTPRKSLLACLQLASHMGSRATDERDRVYGMLGMAIDGAELVKKPSYDENNTLAVMLRDLTLSIIESQGSLNIILCQNMEGAKLDGLPSWIPDFMKFSKSTPRHLHGTIHGTFSAFDCTPGLSEREKKDHEVQGDLLKVQALLWDTVVYIGAAREVYEKEPHFVDIAKSLANTHLSMGRIDSAQLQTISTNNPYASNAETWQVILATITRQELQHENCRLLGVALKHIWDQTEDFRRSLLGPDVTHTVADAIAWLDQNSSFQVCGKSIRAWSEEQEDDGISEKDKLAQMKYLQTILAANFYSRKRLVVTERGLIGNTHGSVEVGDKVAFVAGCSVPVLLRKRKEEHSGFELVGDVYVGGVM